ncbi:MAG: cobalamin-dependent protein [Proteobacteria bacterium]|nr:cobalamin-dependent protein [Pseudomonadota bacterium]
MNENKPIRVLIAKIGCDIHERGPITLMTAFRDAGMEVIYTGRYATPERVVQTAMDEDVDIIALSDHTGSMPIIAESVMAELKKNDEMDIHVMAGGLILPSDIPALENMGVKGNYGPGTPLETIIKYTKSLVHPV